jgi:hypothetical protein
MYVCRREREWQKIKLELELAACNKLKRLRIRVTVVTQYVGITFRRRNRCVTLQVDRESNELDELLVSSTHVFVLEEYWFVGPGNDQLTQATDN